MTFYVAIDPGLNGALVVLTDSGALHSAHRTPLTAGVHDIAAMKAIVATIPKPCVVFCEQPIRVNRGGGNSDSGYLGVCASVKFWRAAFGKVSIATVQPKTWQTVLLSGVQGRTTKDKSINWCRVFLPELDLYPGKCTNPHDGISDAACIAEYGRRVYLAGVRRTSGA